MLKKFCCFKADSETEKSSGYWRGLALCYVHHRQRVGVKVDTLPGVMVDTFPDGDIDPSQQQMETDREFAGFTQISNNVLYLVEDDEHEAFGLITQPHQLISFGFNHA